MTSMILVSKSKIVAVVVASVIIGASITEAFAYARLFRINNTVGKSVTVQQYHNMEADSAQYFMNYLLSEKQRSEKQ